MAKRTFFVNAFSPTATADTTTPLANATYMAIGASGATAGLNVIEIMESGLATTSSVNIMHFARNGIIGAGNAALAAPNSDGPQDTRTAALAAVPLTYVAASTAPQRSVATTAARLNLAFNSFGGIVRWQAAPGQEWGIVGVSVNVSESSLSAFTGGSVGSMSAHIIYEPF